MKKTDMKRKSNDDRGVDRQKHQINQILWLIAAYRPIA